MTTCGEHSSRSDEYASCSQPCLAECETLSRRLLRRVAAATTCTSQHMPGICVHLSLVPSPSPVHDEMVSSREATYMYCRPGLMSPCVHASDGKVTVPRIHVCRHHLLRRFVWRQQRTTYRSRGLPRKLCTLVRPHNAPLTCQRTVHQVDHTRGGSLGFRSSCMQV